MNHLNPKKQHLINLLLNNQSNNFTFEDLKNLANKAKIIPQYHIVLVGGTNGKGSTCAYLTTILTCAGYNVGTFTSPHIINYNERIAINNTYIDDNFLIEALEYIIKFSNNKLGLFNAFTLAAHYIFMQKKVDIAIVEVGIGGRYDITNIFNPIISVITSIDFDHIDILGKTIEEIALQKLGICRNNKFTFFGCVPNIDFISTYAKQNNIYAKLFNRDFYYIKHQNSFDVIYNNNFYGLPYPKMNNNKQILNATLSIVSLSELMHIYPVSASAIKYGLIKTFLSGRFQLISQNPQILIDVAHNHESVTCMLQNIAQLPPIKNNYAVFGILNTKDINSIIKICKNIFTKWFIAEINSPNGQDINYIINSLLEQGIFKNNIISCRSISEAFNIANNYANNNDRIVCFGSFLVVEEILKSSKIYT